MHKQQWIIGGILVLMIALVLSITHRHSAQYQHTTAHQTPDYLRAMYSPLHFKPAALTATDDQCLACHAEVLKDTARGRSPAGLSSEKAKAWYQQLNTYQGNQDTFHRRHLTTPYARQVMNLRCNTCHIGVDLRDQAPGSSATGTPQSDNAFTLRKTVNPETTCLMCHGQMPWKNMNLPNDWREIRESFGNSCYENCHQSIRTVRHNVNFLNASAIEEAGKNNSDVCYGCHGGRAWYRISFPYARQPWPGMPEFVPDWARDRPIALEERFQNTTTSRNFKP